MYNNLKKILFTFVGLIIIGVSFFWTKQNIIEASLQDGQRFDNWTVSCTSTKEKKSLCVLTQQVSTPKDDKVEILAVYQIGYSGDNKKLKMTQILPLGINLQAGTIILSDKKLITPAKYHICTQTGCEATVEISEQDLETILSTPNNYLLHINGEGKQVGYPISNKGLKEGLEALKKEK